MDKVAFCGVKLLNFEHYQCWCSYSSITPQTNSNKKIRLEEEEKEEEENFSLTQKDNFSITSG